MKVPFHLLSFPTHFSYPLKNMRHFWMLFHAPQSWRNLGGLTQVLSAQKQPATVSDAVSDAVAHWCCHWLWWWRLCKCHHQSVLHRLRSLCPGVLPKPTCGFCRASFLLPQPCLPHFLRDIYQQLTLFSSFRRTPSSTYPDWILVPPLPIFQSSVRLIVYDSVSLECNFPYVKPNFCRYFEREREKKKSWHS